MFDYHQALQTLADQVIESNRQDEAISLLKELVLQFPASAQGRLKLGLLLVKKGARDDALYHLRRAVEFDSRCAPGILALARLELDNKNFTRAIELYNTMFLIEQDTADMHQGLIEAYLGIGSIDEAERIARRWLVFSQQEPRAYLALAKILETRGGPDAVQSIRDALESACEIAPKSGEMCAALARFLWKQNGTMDAIQRIRTFLGAGGEPKEPILLVAEILDSVGQQREANEILDETLRNHGTRIYRDMLKTRTKQSPKLGTDRTILFISPQQSRRAIKMSMGLREKGWNVILLTDVRSGEEWANSFFDGIHYCANAAHALAIADRYRAYAQHIFSSWEDDYAPEFVQDHSIPTIVDAYNVIEGEYGQEKELEIRRQRFCIEQADAITCADLRPRYLLKQVGYKRPQHVLLFGDYCWNRPNSSTTLKANGLHVVSSGFVSTKSHIIREEWGYAAFIGNLISQNIHVHIYPTLEQCRRPDFEQFYGELALTQQAAPLLHIYKTPPKDPVREFSQFSCGLSVLGQHVYDQAYPSFSDAHFSICGSPRNADYIDAGLPVLCSPHLTYQKRVFDRFGLSLPLTVTTVGSVAASLLELLRNSALSEQIGTIRQIYSVRSNIPRLISLYEKLRIS